MKLKALPVQDFEDATLNFEQIAGLAVTSLSGSGLRFASGQTTCVGGSTVAVAHGLGVIPVVFGAIAGRAGAAIVPAIADASVDPTATTLTIAATQTVGTGNVYKVWWWAVG